MSSGLRGPNKEYRSQGSNCTCSYCKPRSINGRKWWKKMAHKKARKNNKSIQEYLD